MADYQLLIGDALSLLKTLPEKHCHTCVTSPPYLGLRDYGHDDQIGLEETTHEYIQKLVNVFSEVRRVLRDDGTLWLNMGDTYAANRRNKPRNGKPKDLLGIPWLLALALKEDGWYLRQDIIWHKTNPMPESVTDRCTRAHEYIFLLSKSPRYFLNHAALKEMSVSNKDSGNRGRKSRPSQGSILRGDQKGSIPRSPRSARDTIGREKSKRGQPMHGQVAATHRAGRTDSWDTNTRNRRSVWSSEDELSFINWLSQQKDGDLLVEKFIEEKGLKHSVWPVSVRPYKGAHFATYPPHLIEPCILAGCPVNGIVIDPFGGTGTSAGVAIAHDRNAIICEINPSNGLLVSERVTSIQRMLKGRE